MIDRRPALIARCAGAADVVAGRAVRARRTTCSCRSRGGGHNIAGNAVCDGGLMIDLSRDDGPCASIPVAPAARVEPGATLGDVDRETQAFGLATPVGINSTTGIAGLTLGGGFGWLSRKLGLTIDNLISADVVTADGALAARPARRENPDLFWAIRGGGGNFGVVTSFEFRLHPVGPEVLAGLVVHPLDEAARRAALLPRVHRRRRDEFVVLVRDAQGAAAAVPAGARVARQGDPRAGDVATRATSTKGEKAPSPVRGFGKPIADIVGAMPVHRLAAARSIRC